MTETTDFFRRLIADERGEHGPSTHVGDHGGSETERRVASDPTVPSVAADLTVSAVAADPTAPSVAAHPTVPSVAVAADPTVRSVAVATDSTVPSVAAADPAALSVSMAHPRETTAEPSPSDSNPSREKGRNLTKAELEDIRALKADRRNAQPQPQPGPSRPSQGAVQAEVPAYKETVDPLQAVCEPADSLKALDLS